MFMLPIPLPNFLRVRLNRRKLKKRRKKPTVEWTNHDYYSKWIQNICFFAFLSIVMICLFFSYVTFDLELSTIGDLSLEIPSFNLTLNELSGRASITMPVYMYLFSGIGYAFNNIQLPDLSHLSYLNHISTNISGVI